MDTAASARSSWPRSTRAATRPSQRHLDTGVNTLTGEGLAEALGGATVVVDVSNSPSFEDAAALEFFETSTGNLLAAEAAAGVRHHVALSVVGAERLPDSGYFRAKVAQEQLIKESSIPYSIVRATQFFEFIARSPTQATDGDTVRLPPALIQPIAADDVAGAPRPDLRRPARQRHRRDRRTRAVPARRDRPRRLSARDDPRTVIADPDASYFGTTLAERTLLPGNDAHIADTRFADWLTQATPAK